MNVVLYLRYSSHAQTEQSIEGQDRVCTDWCNREGHTIVGRYIDRATSASKNTEKRIEFNRMIKDAEKCLWQGVVVYKLDRFARNRYDSANYKAKLKRHGVRLMSATEPISDGPESIILEGVLESMAEYYSAELSQKVTRGMNETALKCHSCGGPIPLGYKIENKQFVVDPVGAEIVKEAFDLYARGVSLTHILESFRNKGYRTSRGAEFGKNSFHRMLANERYTGVYKYGDIRIEGGIPAIIDKETFQAVSDRLRINAQAPARGKANVDYLLTQKAFCGHCGAHLVGDCGTSKGGSVYYYYKCAGRKRGHTCDLKPIPKDLLEDVVARDALSMLTPETIDMLADAAVRAADEDNKLNSRLPALEQMLKETEGKIKNLLKLVEQGISIPELSERISELSNQKQDIEKQIAIARTETLNIDKDMVVFFLSRFISGDAKDEKFKRSIIDLLVNSVTVWNDPDGWKVTIVYNLIPGSKVVTCSDLGADGPPMTDNPNTPLVYDHIPLFVRDKRIPLP